MTSGRSVDDERQDALPKTMSSTVVESIAGTRPTTVDPSTQQHKGWRWIDIEVADDTLEEFLALADETGLDMVAAGGVLDLDLPKLDLFEDHVVVVVHGLARDEIRTYEVDLFITERKLVSVRRESSQTIAELRRQFFDQGEQLAASPSEMAARICELLTRRLLAVVDVFDEHADSLMLRALDTDDSVLDDLTAMRSDVSEVRRIMSPQRETLDRLRSATTPLLTDHARRLFADTFDVATRAAAGLDAARTALSEVLDAYRGAEARRATEITKVLTVYAAIMLPLTLIAGVFGMNFTKLPLINHDRGWIVALAAMAIVTIGSLAMFERLGWLERRKRRSGLGRGLIDAARRPVKVVRTGRSRPRKT